jgi:hypothetical protein
VTFRVKILYFNTKLENKSGIDPEDGGPISFEKVTSNISTQQTNMLEKVVPVLHETP